MSFFDKMKQGASDAAKKAQQTVESTRLKTQITSREKQMDRLYNKIGQSVYEAHKTGDVAASEPEVMDFCGELTALEQEIQTLEEKIQQLKAEKACGCGKVVAVNVKFCPDCGKRFIDEPKQLDTTGEIRVICSNCKTDNDISSQYCIQCGHDLAST